MGKGKDVVTVQDATEGRSEGGSEWGRGEAVVPVLSLPHSLTPLSLSL